MPDHGYCTVAAAAQAEFEEKRSRFIGSIAPVSSEEEALAFIASVRAQNRDARHNCHACLLRAGGIKRFSDDGEPQGTAGKPILEVIEREGLTDTALVVTRYFGGILLGAGGLTRAYAQAAKLAVDAAQRVWMRPAVLVGVECDYSLYGKITYLLPRYEAQAQAPDFAGEVRLTLLLPEERLDGFARELTELSAGRVFPQVQKKLFAAFENG